MEHYLTEYLAKQKTTLDDCTDEQLYAAMLSFVKEQTAQLT